MTWHPHGYSKSQINKAGLILLEYMDEKAESVDTEKFIWAFYAVNSWRSSHGYPINTFQATLRSKLARIDPNAIVAQRLKRLPSIVAKLRRLDGMNLSRMQDIGGLRAVVADLGSVRKLEENYRNSRLTHELNDSRDYIDYPKASGYRSVHLVYKYENPRAVEYNGLFVELQIRTRLQHAWATAVETMGTFLNHSLKASEGPEPWLDFFSLSGSAFAHLEGTPPVPGYEGLSKIETFAAVADGAKKLGIKEKLLAFTIAAERVHADRRAGSFHLVVLDPVKMEVSIRSYGYGSLEEANREYAEIEKRIAGGEPIQAVLVSAGTIEDLRKAYPNYFLDTHEFVQNLDRVERLWKSANKRLQRTG